MCSWHMAMMACIPWIAMIACKYGEKQCPEACVWKLLLVFWIFWKEMADGKHLKVNSHIPLQPYTGCYYQQ